MISLATRTIAEEQMDAPDLPADVYRQVLADLSKVNVVTFSSRPTLSFLKRAVGDRRSFSLLDVGFGQGDMLRTIAKWAARRGVEAQLVGVDLNPNSEIMAREATDPSLPIRYLTGDYHDQAGGGWDFVISSIVTHHMTPAEIDAFLRFMEAESRTGWLVNDLHRHRFAYFGFPLLARLARWHRIVREDGQLSIARSFRPEEWRALLATAGLERSGARIVRRFPFRLCVERVR
jgi:2-polyprenyl-3-methyl-5-hydroxy-6-metoxy-1,4-benzoquinol methylase